MSTYTYTPAHTLAECDRILTAPGALLETERVLVDCRVLRSFKNLAPSLRAFWLDCVVSFGPKPYILFESQRLTYDELHARAARLACVLRETYGVRKGDRVAIGMRNCAEWVIAFWACHLLGAVSAQVNAWLPAQPFLHCLALVAAKVVLVDPERAKVLVPHLAALRKGTRVLVARADGGAPRKDAFRAPRGMASFDGEIDAYRGPLDAWRQEPECTLDDNATIFFTSGTTGMPKAVLATQRSFQHGFMISVYARERMLLRRGMETWGRGDPKSTNGILIGVPLFHVTGCTFTLVLYTWQGWRNAFIRKWDKDAAAELMQREGIVAFGGVPSQVQELADTRVARRPFMQQVSWGGAPAPARIAAGSARDFPGALVACGYGMTETNAGIVNFGADDFLARPASTGLAAPVNEILIVDTASGKERPTGETGEVWIRGASVMREYWNDPAATEKTLTRDGWLKTGDLGYVDAEGFLYLVDRVKDIIIRGGENIASVSVENAIYADDRIQEVAVVGVPDEKLGELVAAVVFPKPEFADSVTEAEVVARAKQSLPHFAVPAMVVLSRTPLERNAAGKVMKKDVKKAAEAEWTRRNAPARKPRAKL